MTDSLFLKEVDLQRAFGAFLGSIGHTVELEKAVKHDGFSDRIDILTGNLLIECKTVLTRETGYVAMGQLSNYSQDYPFHKKLIVVEKVLDENARKRALSAEIAVVEIRRDRRFLDWYLPRTRRYQRVADRPLRRKLEEDFVEIPAFAIAMIIVTVFVSLILQGLIYEEQNSGPNFNHNRTDFIQTQ